ncbi:MAG TPA: FtsX-like permease family protein [Pirellulales bacterium]|jgi:putative ABC transport system permease protein|nr:FtsX-like permease family protein [Pirellulales bacterium]
MRFIQFIGKNVLRRKVRSTLTGIGVAVAISAVVALLGVASGFEQSSREMLTGRGVDLIVKRAGSGDFDTTRLDESIGPQLAAVPGVSQVTPELDDTVKLNDDPLGIRLEGLPPESPTLQELSQRIDAGHGQGRGLTPSDRNCVLLGTILARNLNKKPGDTVEIEGQKFKVAGIYQGASILENRGAVAHLDELQKLMDRAGQVSEFEIMLKPGLAGNEAAVDRVRTDIQNLTGLDGKPYHLSAMTTEQYVDNDNGIKLAGAMAWMTSSIALVIGAIGMLNTMIMSVLERTQEIGILRAIGWRKARVMRMILGESFALSLGGAVVGTGLALFLTAVVSRLPAAEGLVRPDVSFRVIVTGFLLSLVLGLVGGAYPAIRGARLAPTEALRYE